MHAPHMQPAGTEATIVLSGVPRLAILGFAMSL